jgi:hypothetical protein
MVQILGPKRQNPTSHSLDRVIALAEPLKKSDDDSIA